MANVTVIEDTSLSTLKEKRYIVVDKETGAVLDDAQGYGFKSVKKAHAAYSYKTRDKSKDAERKFKEDRIRTWLKENQDFADLMDVVSFEIEKGSCGPNEKFNASVIKKLLKEKELDCEFTPGELLKVWEKGV